MKEMIYQTERKIETLDTGYCLGLLYYILNLGTHPCAYVKIPKTHKFYKKDYDDIDIDVHGGLTYSRDFLWVSENQKVKGWFIGWDYAHYGDYLGFEMLPIFNNLAKQQNKDKRWSTEEIFKDVKEVCYQIQKDIEKGNNNE